ncbi:hypothetical protein CJ030_MR8G027009 [Morella rubra]|uniref:Uncharacterized protein n=1 Tax=Morella rubra TaxID=262757 RepID=A0A6A1UNY3_9ROSI|nr:hypothetical protein CJ030_MR8G027009 [Morella rubra]
MAKGVSSSKAPMNEMEEIMEPIRNISWEDVSGMMKVQIHGLHLERLDEENALLLGSKLGLVDKVDPVDINKPYLHVQSETGKRGGIFNGLARRVVRGGFSGGGVARSGFSSSTWGLSNQMIPIPVKDPQVFSHHRDSVSKRGPQESKWGQHEGQVTWSSTSSGCQSRDIEFFDEVVCKGQTGKIMQGQAESSLQILDSTVLGLSNVLGKLLNRKLSLVDMEDTRETKYFGLIYPVGPLLPTGLSASPFALLEALDGMVNLKREGATIHDPESLLKRQRELPTPPKLLWRNLRLYCLIMERVLKMEQGRKRSLVQKGRRLFWALMVWKWLGTLR